MQTSKEKTEAKPKPPPSSTGASGLFGEEDELFADQPSSQPPAEETVKDEEKIEESPKPVKKKPAGAVSMFGGIDPFSKAAKKTSKPDSDRFGESVEKEGDLFTSLKEPPVVAATKVECTCMCVCVLHVSVCVCVCVYVCVFVFVIVCTLYVCVRIAYVVQYIGHRSVNI